MSQLTTTLKRMLERTHSKHPRIPPYLRPAINTATTRQHLLDLLSTPGADITLKRVESELGKRRNFTFDEIEYTLDELVENAFIQAYGEQYLQDE